MGIYAKFWHCHPAGLAEEFLSGPLAEFASWCEETAAEFPDDIEPSTLPLLDAVQARGAGALGATTEAEATAVDRLLDTYFGLFCDARGPNLKRAADPSLLYLRHFEGMFGRSKESSVCGSAYELWNFMFTGRAVGRDQNRLPYCSEDGVYRLAYWTFHEVLILGDAFAAGSVPVDMDVRAVTAASSALTRARDKETGLILEVA